MVSAGEGVVTAVDVAVVVVWIAAVVLDLVLDFGSDDDVNVDVDVDVAVDVEVGVTVIGVVVVLVAAEVVVGLGGMVPVWVIGVVGPRHRASSVQGKNRLKHPCPLGTHSHTSSHS